MFKNVLKQLREEKGITQSDLAYAIGVQPGAIGNYEQGQRMPKDDKTWIKIAQYFNVSVDYLMDVPNAIKPLAADTASLDGKPIIIASDTIDKTQQRRNALADKIRNSDYTNEQLDKIEKMIDLMI